MTKHDRTTVVTLHVQRNIRKNVWGMVCFYTEFFKILDRKSTHVNTGWTDHTFIPFTDSCSLRYAQTKKLPECISHRIEMQEQYHPPPTPPPPPIILFLLTLHPHKKCHKSAQRSGRPCSGCLHTTTMHAKPMAQARL